ncbi:MAG: flagellar motor protein MotB [Nitrospiria bacterium]
MGRKAQEEEKLDTDGWMATFADLLSLMLTFFVLLFAMKSVDQGKLEETLGYFRQGGIGVLRPGVDMPVMPPESSLFDPRVIREFSPQEVQKIFDTTRLLGQVDLRKEKEGIVISMSSEVMFFSGESRLRSEAEEALDEIVRITQAAEYDIQVGGHTDNQPISTPRYKSNWDLSVARAGSVVRYMLKDGKLKPKRFSVVGYGDTRPLVPNDTPENRAKNRRVDIVFLK